MTATPESLEPAPLEARKARARAWFEAQRDNICAAFEALEAAAPSALYAGEPGMFAGLSPLLLSFFFEPARRRWTYPRLSCPEYKPTKEIMFALVAMTISAVLGLVVFLLTALAGIDVVRPFFEHAPAWAALVGAGAEGIGLLDGHVQRIEASAPDIKRCGRG